MMSAANDSFSKDLNTLISRARRTSRLIGPFCTLTVNAINTTDGSNVPGVAYNPTNGDGLVRQDSSDFLKR
jgi:hypothetical protein